MVTITLEQVRAAQKAAPLATETKELQRAFAAQRNAILREERRKISLQTDIARRAKDAPKFRGNAGDPVGIWTICGVDRVPNVGAKVRLYPSEIITYDGEIVGSVSSGHAVIATVMRIGAHWSDQPHGDSGYHLYCEYARPVGAEMVNFG